MPRAFAYTPALETDGVHFPGGHINLSCYQDPSDQVFCAWGTDATATPVAPFLGELNIVPLDLLFILPQWIQPRFDLTLPIPANPTLSGAHIMFQTLVGSNIPNGNGTFGNARTVQIQ